MCNSRQEFLGQAHLIIFYETYNFLYLTFVVVSPYILMCIPRKSKRMNIEQCCSKYLAGVNDGLWHDFVLGNFPFI
jgi:hypothetical protein